MMNKKLIFGFVLVCLSFVSFPVKAFHLETLVNVSSKDNFSYTAYMPVFNGTDALFGFSAELPGQKYRDGQGRQANADILIGLRTTLPIFDLVDIYAVFDDNNGMIRTGNNTGSDIAATKIGLSKKFLYPINDHITVGISAVLGEVYIDGQKYITLLPDVYPVFGMTIEF